ncbi:hypothetical protein PN36_22065 [Candidatus Thiomargarita nelsonii]|uniref:Small-conductance mechanosensitive channel n=1 Tax=Candidatus Thiomargarita nelsonii TaxID=1003181 RepID=A0A0A6RT68_9GAMM|nr:hypothetical protein PN36_22065 [Candidatus Thiomargarita nelsonii]
MYLFKPLLYSLIICVSLVGLPVNAETTDSVITPQWIEKLQRAITEAQTALEKESLALPTEEQALGDKIDSLQTVKQITPKMLEQAANQWQAANQKVEERRVELQTHLDKLTALKTEKDIALQQQAVELEQQYIDLLKKQYQLAIKRNVFAIKWHTQLQILPQLRLIKEREQAIADGKTALARRQKTLEKIEEELPNQIISLDAMTFDYLTKLFEEVILYKDTAEVDVNNLLLERQNAETLLDKLRQSINKQEVALEKWRQTPPVAPEQQPIHDKKVAEQEARLEVQKKKLKLDQQDIDLIGQRLEQAKEWLELGRTWIEKLQVIYPKRQKQAFEQKMQQEQQGYMHRAAELRLQLNRIPEENAAQRELLSIQIQEANEQAQQVERQSELDQKPLQIAQWEKTAQTLQESQEISRHQLNNLAIWIEELNVSLQELQASQDLLLAKKSVLVKQQQLVEKRARSFSDTSLEYNQQAQQILAKFQTTQQQELEQIHQLQEKGQQVLTLLETVYKEKRHLALSKPRQLPTNTAEWQSLLGEIATLPIFLLRQLQFTGQGLIQAFQQTQLQRWGIIGIIILIWLGLVIGSHIWFNRILNILSNSKIQRFVGHLLPALHLWRLNILSITVISIFLLLLWLTQPAPLSFTVTLTLLLTWLVCKLLINLSWLSLAAPEAKIQNHKLYRQLRRVILIIGSLTVITVLMHIENQAYADRLSLTIRDLGDSLFMILLSLTVLPLWQIRRLILTTLSENLTGDWRLINHLITLIVPAILIISILGLVGYINLGWTVVQQFSLFLAALIVWMIARRITYDLINWWKNSVKEDNRLYELWQEDIIPLVQKLLGIVLLALAVVFYFWITGGLVDAAVKDDIAQFLSFSLITLGNGNQITVGSVLLSVFIIWFVFWLGSWFRGVSHRWVYLKIKDVGLRNSLSVFTQYGVIIIGLLIALKAIGIDPTALAVFAGALGVGVGFGLQNIVNNFVSGILLLVGRHIRVGDLVTIGSFENLTVKEINWINTRFDQFGIKVVIPNSDILGSKIKNFTLPDDKNLVWFWPSIYIDPQIPPEKVEKILTEALTGIEGLVDIWVLMAGLKPSGVMEYWPCFTCTYPDRWGVQERVWHRIWTHLKQAGIEPAVPSQEIRMFDGTQGQTMHSGTPHVPPMA